MSDLTIPLLPEANWASARAGGGAGGAKDETVQARDAAQQFEALLLGQILRTVREGSGWGQSDSAGECATDFADQQFALALARQGGLGLAALIAAGLERKPGGSVVTSQSRP